MRSIVLTLISLACSGCFQVDLYAPHGKKVYLISSEEPVKVRRVWRTWFVVWGVVPLDNTMPDKYITSEDLTNVRVITIDTVPDAFIGLLYNVLLPIGLVNQSIAVEGNRSRTDSESLPAATNPAPSPEKGTHSPPPS